MGDNFTYMRSGPFSPKLLSGSQTEFPDYRGLVLSAGIADVLVLGEVQGAIANRGLEFKVAICARYIRKIFCMSWEL